jgi:hypothetical protein
MLSDWGLTAVAALLAIAIIVALWTGYRMEAALLWVSVCILQLCREVRDIAVKMK